MPLWTYGTITLSFKKGDKIVKQNETLKLKVKRLGINGEGIAFYKKTIVFIDGALPKEDVLVQITQRHPRYMKAKLLRVLTPSRDRVTPACPYFNDCGGCQLQHLAYQKQLDYKKDVIAQSLQRFKPQGWESFPLYDTIGMEEPYHYRNKLQYQIRTWRSTAKMGLFKENSHDVVSIDRCLVQDPLTTKIANVCFQLIKKYHLSIYDEKKHRGLVKTLMVRIGQKTKEAQAVLITTEEKWPRMEGFIHDLKKQCPEVVSIMQNINHDKTSLIMGERTILRDGKEAIEEKLDDITFNLSARAFFQLNPSQTEKLYAEVRKALNASKDDVVVDAYCGVGTIGLSLASSVKYVYGMDTIPAAIEDANLNAKRLGFDNTHYEVGAAEDVLPQWLDNDLKPTAIVVDPPRTGLDDALLQSLRKHRIQKLVYVSCNASTLAKDLTQLTDLYNVNYIQSVDMFPQTARVEAVVSMTLKDK